MPKRRVNLSLMLVNLYILQFSFIISAIRKDISLQEKICRTTVQGRYLLSDDNGHVCDALSVDPQSRCCRGKEEQFSCHGCNLVSQCCNSYEYCVSCCLNPARTQKELALKVKVAKPVTAGTYSSIFDFCAGPADKRLELRLAGISIVIGKQGESCDSVCKSRGQSCVPNKLTMLNQCEMIQKYMSCKGACLASVGADQPAEVVDDAPRHLNPGACLYTRTQSILSCDGSHRHTRRLCPCA